MAAFQTTEYRPVQCGRSWLGKDPQGDESTGTTGNSLVPGQLSLPQCYGARQPVRNAIEEARRRKTPQSRQRKIVQTCSVPPTKCRSTPPVILPGCPNSHQYNPITVRHPPKQTPPNFLSLTSPVTCTSASCAQSTFQQLFC